MIITRATFSTKQWWDRYIAPIKEQDQFTEACKTQASVRAAQTEQVLNSDRKFGLPTSRTLPLSQQTKT